MGGIIVTGSQLVLLSVVCLALGISLIAWAMR